MLLKTSRIKITLFFLFALLAVSFFALTVGSVNIGFKEVWSAFFGKADKTVDAILFELRLPRILLAVAVGGGLSVAGAVLQAVLKNPLAEPYILGVSSGGTFGAMLSMLLGLSFFFTQIFAFAGSLLVIGLIIFLGNKFGLSFRPTTILLSGVMIGAFFGAAILIALTLMRENLQTAVFWLVGTLSFAAPESSVYVFFFSLAVALFLISRSYGLNLISLDNDDSYTLGINVRRERIIQLAASGILTGGLVAVSGVIGFVGMITPHIIRNKFGFDNRIVLPLSFIAGAIILVVADTFARTIILPSELPVGAITAVFGAPLFIWFLKKKDYYFNV